MSHLRLLSRSVASAVMIIALAHLFSQEGGEFLAFPGQLIGGLSEVAVMLLSESESYYPISGYAPLFNIIFYSISIYLVSWLYAAVKRDDALRRESLHQYILRNPND